MKSKSTTTRELSLSPQAEACAIIAGARRAKTAVPSRQRLQKQAWLALLAVLGLAALSADAQTKPPAKVPLQEAGIADIQRTILAKQITSTGIVELYLKRIKAYNNACVNVPSGILGPITSIPHAKQINALSTLNLRPAARVKWGFDERKARS